MVIVLFGVSGCGKTTVGRLLADDLGWSFYEGDDYHSQTNIQKMKAGKPLTDEDRRPWLQQLRQVIQNCLNRKENAVLACSALKKSYREILRVDHRVRFVYLHGTYQLIRDRVEQRRGHFMNPELLKSQFQILEEPASVAEAMRIEITDEPRVLVDQIKGRLRLARG